MAWSYSSVGTSGMSAIVGPFSSSQSSLWKFLLIKELVYQYSLAMSSMLHDV
jgi:hypothetical protein